MVRQCQVCKKTDYLRPDLSFHRFPVNHEKRNMWFSLLGWGEKKQLPKHSYICSNHFAISDVATKINGSKYLKPDASPMLCDTQSPTNSPDCTVDHTLPKKINGVFQKCACIETSNEVKLEPAASSSSDMTTGPEAASKSRIIDVTAMNLLTELKRESSDFAVDDTPMKIKCEEIEFDDLIINLPKELPVNIVSSSESDYVKNCNFMETSGEVKLEPVTTTASEPGSEIRKWEITAIDPSTELKRECFDSAVDDTFPMKIKCEEIEIDDVIIDLPKDLPVQSESGDVKKCVFTETNNEVKLEPVLTSSSVTTASEFGSDIRKWDITAIDPSTGLKRECSDSAFDDTFPMKIKCEEIDLDDLIKSESGGVFTETSNEVKLEPVLSSSSVTYYAYNPAPKAESEIGKLNVTALNPSTVLKRKRKRRYRYISSTDFATPPKRKKLSILKKTIVNQRKKIRSLQSTARKLSLEIKSLNSLLTYLKNKSRQLKL